MCDYSLGGLPNRLAVEGEELIVHRFSTGSMGLASPADLQTFESVEEPLCQKTLWQAVKSFFAFPSNSPSVPAVCVPPGARLAWKTVPGDVQRQWGIKEEEDVRFVQTSAEVNQYRDALRLHNGRHILLQDLREGTRLRVLSSGGGSDGEREYVFVKPRRVARS